MTITRKQLLNACRYLSLKFDVIHNRVFFRGDVPQEIKEALKTNPEIEVELILKEACKNSDLLDSIKERASIKWSEGLSDSLYNAVLCNIQPIGETPERDENGKIILKPQSDWEEELKKYS